MPAAAIPFIVGGIGAASSVASGIIGSNAAGKAADTQAAAANNAAQLQKQAADEALAFQKQQYGNSLNLLSPFYNTGVAANNRLSYLMGLSPQQGLPTGVINPNAPAPANTGNNLSGLLGGRFNTGGDTVLPGTSGGFMRANAYGGIVPSPLGGPITDSPFQPSPLGTPRTSGPFQPSSLNPGGSLSPGDFGPPQFIPDANDPSQVPFTGNPDVGRFAPGGTIDATRGNLQVPRVDGGGLPGQAAPGGDFGSLSQGFNEQFTAPTDVTEQNDPGYKFRLQQGMDALQRSAAARGGLLSGGTAKDINDYAQSQASSEYGNVYNRSFNEYTNRFNVFKQNQADLFNRLSALSGGGQVSAGQLSNAGLTTANNAGNILLGSAGQIGQQLNNAAAARGSGYVGSANAISGAVQGGLNSLGTAAILKILQGGSIS